MSQNANYTMAGSEKYVNSGLLLQKAKDKSFLALQTHLQSHSKKQERTNICALSTLIGVYVSM